MSGPSPDDLRLRAIEAAVARLSARVEALERMPPAAVPLAAASTADAAASDDLPARAPAAVAAAREAAPGWLSLVGRTCLVLAGAFLLRALTNAGSLPMAVGIWIGLAYAALWFMLASRTSGLSAFLHGLSALLVALPLVVEATLSVHVLSSGAASLALGAIAAIALGIAWARSQRAFALVAMLGAVGAAFALAIGLSQMTPPATVVPPVLALLAIGTAALWVSYGRGWTWLPWPAAGAANVGVLLLAVRAGAVPPREALLATQFVLALLILLYLGSFIIRVVLHEREVRLFEIVQTTAVLLLGLGGATLVAQSHAVSISGPALPCVLAGGVLYVQTFARVAPRRGFDTEFYYAGMTALALVLVGISLLFRYPVRPIMLAGVALTGSLMAWRLHQPMLALQGALAAIVASAQSGLITFTAVV